MLIDRQELRLRLARLAATQSGHFTAAQALSLGYSYQAQKFHTDRGNWLRVDRGLFRLPEWPIGEHDDLVRWTLWSKSRAVVSHETALAAHNLGDVNPTLIHLTVPVGFRSRAPEGIRLHIGELHDKDLWQYEGFKITTPLRTLLDVAVGTLDLDQFAEAVRQARERIPGIDDELVARSEDFGPRAALRAERALRFGDQF